MGERKILGTGEHPKEVERYLHEAARFQILVEMRGQSLQLRRGDGAPTVKDAKGVPDLEIVRRSSCITICTT